MPEKKLGVMALAALVVSAMIGGGIFSLPQNMAQGAAVMAVIFGWCITGFGMYFLANTFRLLSDARPDATTGIYAYARLGFGRFAGFEMAWAYWLCNIFGNVGYAVLLMDAMNYFFPGTFSGGNNGWSILGGSCVIWLMNFIVLKGIRQATVINSIGTVFKLLPILLFIVIMIGVFSAGTFSFDLWGNEQAVHLGTLGAQIRSTMLVTLWAFIGIEGAVVLSGRAKSPQTVGRATMVGFLCCLAIYACLSILPFGKMHQSELAKLANPSTAPLLSAVVGSWGGWVMNIGVIIALLTSWLAFTIMIAQIPYAAAQDGTFPKIFARTNAHGTPSVSLWVTSGVMQLAMIFVFFAGNAWNTMLSVTAVMILPPYLGCTLYLWKLCRDGEYPEGLPAGRTFALACGVIGSLYALWMIYAAGLSYLFAACIFLALGIPVFCKARREENREKGTDEPVFSGREGAFAVLIFTLALIAAVTFAGKSDFIREHAHKWSREIRTNWIEWEENHHE